MSDQTDGFLRPDPPDLPQEARGDLGLTLVLGAMALVVGLLAFAILTDRQGALDPDPAPVVAVAPQGR